MSYDLIDLRSRVRTKINDSSYTGSTIDGFINEAITELAGLHPWIYFQKLVSGALTIGDYTYDQQSDHQTTTAMILLHPTTPLAHWDITRHYLPWEKFFHRFPAPDTYNNAQPFYWSEYGNQIYFNCPVDMAYTLRQFYQKTPTELVNDTDVPELSVDFREAIVLGATYRCEEERENYDIAMMLENRFDSRASQLIARFANSTMTGPDTVVSPSSRPMDIWGDEWEDYK